VTEVQVGCVEHCYGTTTLDTSGLTLAQIEQLLGELQVPSPPSATAAPAGEQNTTQQSAAQSENGEGKQSQVAHQTNGTVQVVVTPKGAPADGGTGAAAVNQTAQGIAQLQVGCIFYCSGTQQAQQAQQSNTTVQSVDSSGAGAVNTVSKVVSQVQVGCVAWCYDSVETQTATGGDSSVVAVVPPLVGASPVVAPTVAVSPVAPSPVQGSSPPPSSPGARTRGSGGAPVLVQGGGITVVSVSVSPGAGPAAGDGASLVSVEASRTVQTQFADPHAHRAHRIVRHRGAPRRAHTQPRAVAGEAPIAVPGSSTARPTLELALALVLAALTWGGLRRRPVR
jgi:hypothetical protein